jgi:alpha-glucoside transport system substrate-binding protein
VGQIGGTVSVVGSWTGSEQESFEAMVAPFEESTGVDVQYTGSRDLAAQLTTGVQSGNLPDVAGLPGPGLMIEWYDQGALKPLDFVDLEAYRADTPEGFADLGVAEDGTLIGIFVKAAVKGLIWYNVANYDGERPATWADVEAMDPAPAESLWCIGFESGAASGWPGTDWIEDIVLRQSGPEVYDAWVRGELPWSSPEIRGAFETFGRVVESTAGGGNAIITTPFGSGGNGLFADPPECLFHHQASFMSDFFVNEAGAAPEDFDFFVMPPISEEVGEVVTGAGDLFGMFNDTPQARALIAYLLTPEAQQIWVERGGAISASRSVPTDVYPDAASQKSAQALQEAESFRFDGSDQMPAEMNDAFFRAMVNFAQNPDQLDTILADLDGVQQDAYE